MHVSVLQGNQSILGIIPRYCLPCFLFLVSLCTCEYVCMSVGVLMCLGWKTALDIDSQELSTLLLESPVGVRLADQARVAGQ